MKHYFSINDFREYLNIGHEIEFLFDSDMFFIQPNYINNISNRNDNNIKFILIRCINWHDNDVVTPLEPLTYDQARAWAAAEQNLLCINRDAALAIVSYYPSAIWHPAHKGGIPCGYLNHFHLNKGHEYKHKNHIWYYGE
ncbi:MAG: hypothetical protein J6V80_03975 [Clostridia bacterium]|nr:hypothetical protein [Clostridia bacterium]